MLLRVVTLLDLFWLLLIFTRLTILCGEQEGAPSFPPLRDTLLNELEGVEASSRMPGDEDGGAPGSSRDEAGGGKGKRWRGGGDGSKRSGAHPSEGGKAEAAGDTRPRPSEGGKTEAAGNARPKAEVEVEVVVDDEEQLQARRSALRERYEAVRRYEDEAAQAVLAAQTRQLVAVSSPLLEQLVRLRRDLDNARVRERAERQDAYDKVSAGLALNGWTEGVAWWWRPGG